ncbi:hypothetical protein [Glaciihabitans arcticus]|nr:hypothetical protein [Glaciihabitans arcticus]
MSDLKLPGDEKDKPKISFGRIVIWVVVGGIGVYYLISAAVGLLSKG